MGAAGFIARRPLVVIAIWIIVAAASAPLFMKLNNVLVTQEQGLLPPNTESQIAAKLVKNITGSTGEDYAILLVDNVNVSSPDTALKIAEWYGADKSQLSQYAEKTSGYPVIIYQAYQKIMNQTSVGFDRTLESVNQSIKAALAVNETISKSMEINFMLLNKTRETRGQLINADKAYVQLYSKLVSLRHGYISLNQTAYTLSYLWTIMPETYSRVWFDVSRVNYFILINTTAYQTGNLSSSDIILVEQLTNKSKLGPVTPDKIVAYYRILLNLTNGNPSLIDYRTISKAAFMVTAKTLESQVGPSGEKLAMGILKTYSDVWTGLLEKANMTNLPYLYRVMPQDNVYSTIKSLEPKAKTYAITVFAPVMAGEMASKTGMNETLLTSFIEKASRLTYPPSRGTVNDLVKNLLLQTARTSEEKQMLETLMQIVSTREPTPSDALSILSKQISSQAGAEVGKALTLILGKYDPSAEGVLVKDNVKLADATAELIASMSPPQLRAVLNETTIYSIVYKYAYILGEANKTENDLNKTVNENLHIILNALEKQVLAKIPKEARGFMAELFEKTDASPLEKQDIPTLLTPILVKQALQMSNNTRMPAEAIEKTIQEAFNVIYYHNETRSQAINKLSTDTFYTIYPRIVEQLKGYAVTGDLMAFIVMFKPYAQPSEEDPTYYYQAMNYTSIVNNTLRNYVAGYKLYLTGSGIINYETHKLTSQDMKRVDMLSNTMVVIFLFLVLESLAAVILPFIGILVAILVAGALAYLIVTGGIVDLSSWARVVMMTTSLGLGADYAGFLSYRFREEYHNTKDAKTAAERALSRTYAAILTSATTAIIGFGSLSLAHDFPFLLSFGVAIPLAIFVTMLAGLTLVPALLSLLGGHSKFWWPKTPEKLSVRSKSWLGEKVVKYAKVIVLIWIIISIPSAYAYATFKGSHNMQVFLPENSDAVKNFNMVAERFGAGIVYQTYVVVELKEPWNTTAGLSALKHIEELVKSKDYVSGISGPLEYVNYTKAMGSTERNPYVSSDGRTVYLNIYIKDNPLSNKGISDIKDLRETLHREAVGNGVEKLYVGGMAASMLEMETLLNDRFYHRVLPVAVTLMIIAFAIAFNSIVAALAAITVIITSAMIAIASTELLFQDMIGKPVLWFLPIMVLTAILGVGMDYNSFYLSRAREECFKECSDKSIVLATARVGLLVFGLSLILGSAYLSMMSSSTWGMRELGFTMGAGVLLAGAMASYLVNPSIIALLKDKMWRKIR
ncbi:MAG: MMPL family transporter [Desulfurococcales archaeon]|nr:MMPL family transporter [Desulfurococcales archaeon]